MSRLRLFSGVVLLPASVIFGELYQYFGAPVAFGFSSGCALGAALLFWRWSARVERA